MREALKLAHSYGGYDGVKSRTAFVRRPLDYRAGARQDMEKALRAFERSFAICADDFVDLARQLGTRA